MYINGLGEVKGINKDTTILLSGKIRKKGPKKGRTVYSKVRVKWIRERDLYRIVLALIDGKKWIPKSKGNQALAHRLRRLNPHLINGARKQHLQKKEV